MALFSKCHKRPSNLVAAAAGCFLRPGERVLVTATLSHVSVWTSEDTDFETAPLRLLVGADYPVRAVHAPGRADAQRRNACA
jgi:hypothetical protein